MPTGPAKRAIVAGGKDCLLLSELTEAEEEGSGVLVTHPLS